MKKLYLLMTLLSGFIFSSTVKAKTDWWQPFSKLDTGDTAWVMISTILVLFMTIPGLALFYAGMVRKKNVLSTMMYSFSVTALVSVLWIVAGYSLAFTEGNGFIGSLDRLFLSGMGLDLSKGLLTIAPNAQTIPESVFMFFQMTFAIISVAIISGAFAERMKYSAMLWFSGAWFLLVYVPICHWVWGGGFMAQGGVLDYAGGTVVHINAGIAGLVTAIMLGKRIGYGRESMAPHNMVFTLIGASMLWIGWFGFNAGSALSANASAGMAMVVTQVSAGIGALTWLVCEGIEHRKATSLGLASGAVSGLVGITPAAGFVNPMGAIFIGLLTTIACYFSVTRLKHKLGYDDTLDAFGIHGFGGIIGAILTGIFFDNSIFSGNTTVYKQLIIQLKDAGIVIAYSAVMSFFILKVVARLCNGLRVERDEEREGLDISIHGERVE
ncbi:ammonium transporter [Bisgaardia hudsonensis]|uniref:Ammonium transporter n=1 Tax=Bisgaardia hudsonensis TaxID=109472 RepID=A0A4R2N1K4_9PAST|nr:ammonium transporter [Bisgaardia hudsonensis]QLB13033.1 ammonia channel protein [Bisgaardia hudsonensis]TCP13403.1 ammonium transporter [Bisgaardia hudsonensis]